MITIQNFEAGALAATNQYFTQITWPYTPHHQKNNSHTVLAVQHQYPSMPVIAHKQQFLKLYQIYAHETLQT